MRVWKGQTVVVQQSQLQSQEITINWMQNWGEQKRAQYYAMPFTKGTYGVRHTSIIRLTITTDGEQSVIFIETSRLDSFKSKCAANGDLLSVIIDESFQFNENKQETKR